MKKLSARKAWNYLADKWRSPSTSDDGKALVQIGGYSCFGLCHSLAVLEKRGLITPRVLKNMYIQLEIKQEGRTGYWWPATAKGAKTRVQICLELANL